MPRANSKIGVMIIAGLLAGNSDAIAQIERAPSTYTKSITLQNLSSSATRVPTRTDDTTAGRVTGDNWISAAGNFQAIKVNAGQAVWSAINPPLPCDTFAANAAAPEICQGVKRMRTGYAGALLQLTRGSDSTPFDVPQLSNGAADEASAKGFCTAKGDFAANTCYITKAYNQTTTGATRDSTATAGANAPLWTPGATLAGAMAMSFASVRHSLGTGPIQAQTVRYMSVPTAFAWDPNNSAVIMAAQPQNNLQTSITFEPTDHLGGLGYGVFLAPNIYEQGAGVYPSLPTRTSPSVFGRQWQTNTITFAVDNQTKSQTAGAALSGKTGAYIGTNQTSIPAGMNLGGLIVYNRTTTTQEFNDARTALETLFNTAPQAGDNIVVNDGDSTSSDAGSLTARTFQTQALNLLSRPVRAHNVALFGDTMASRASGFTSRITPLYDPAAKSFIVHILAGANDIRQLYNNSFGAAAGGGTTTGGGCTTQPTWNATASGGQLTSVVPANLGAGCASAPTVNIGGTGAVTANVVGGQVTSYTITNPGVSPTALVASIYANVRTYVNAVHALGANAKVVLGTEMVQCDVAGNPTNLGALQAYNTLISANTAGADAIADYQADSYFGPGNYTSSNFCLAANSPDGQHPTDSFMAYPAQIEAAAVNGLLQ